MEEFLLLVINIEPSVSLFWLAEKETLHPSDIMIIAGDAGYVWDKDYVYDMESLQQVFPGTIAFVDGNHAKIMRS